MAEIFYADRIVKVMVLVNPYNQHSYRIARDEVDRIIHKAMQATKNVLTNPDTYLRSLMHQRNAAGQTPIRADYLAEQQFIATLKAEGLNAQIYSEESGVVTIGDPDDADAIMMLLDPLDGSKNFRKGIDVGCISVAYGDNKKTPRLSDLSRGAVLNLYTNEEYFAVRDTGAWYNEHPIFVYPRDCGDYEYLHYYTYTDEIKKYMKGFSGQFITQSLGSVAWELAMVANHQIHTLADVRGRIKAHDFAAAKIIVEAAGAEVCLLGRKEEQIPLDEFDKGYQLIASHDSEACDSLVYDLQRILDEDIRLEVPRITQ